MENLKLETKSRKGGLNRYWFALVCLVNSNAFKKLEIGSEEKEEKLLLIEFIFGFESSRLSVMENNRKNLW